MRKAYSPNNLLTNRHISLLVLLFSAFFLFAQESCYEQYFREHNKEIFPAIDENDDSYDELKKMALARQIMYNGSAKESSKAERADQHAPSNGMFQPLLLAIDTVTGICHLLSEDGAVLATAHLALVDSTWYLWLSVDPLADKYIYQSPYVYANNNPVRYIDPNGMWTEDENGNLVAEKNDNAWTFSRYLNVNIGVAKQMLKEQGYCIKNNILQIKVGDIFAVDYGNFSDSDRPTLSGMGGLIRFFAGSEFNKDMYEHYAKGEGDYTLTSQQFAGILMCLKSQESALSPGTNSVSFYSHPVYNYIFGTAQITCDANGRVQNIYDVYDFDAKPLGARSFQAELITRMVQYFSPESAKGFSISYGKK